MQNWFGLTQGQSTPYRLYSLSNIGSLTALITYPFLMEVYLDIPTQGGVWSVGYVCFALAISILGWRCTKQGLAHETENDKPQPTVEGPPTTKQMGKWAALAALCIDPAACRNGPVDTGHCRHSISLDYAIGHLPDQFRHYI